jgi:DNA processing protein
MPISIRDLLILSHIPGIGSNRLRALVNHFGDPHAVGSASARQLIRVEGIERKTALAVVSFFQGRASEAAERFASDQIARINGLGGRIVSYWDSDYPSNLKRIYDPPPLLFVRGEFTEVDSSSIAIVGTRNPSPYGTGLAERFATGIARLGLTVVSGLARGIDSTAHVATLRAHGRTIAVIGSGVDVIYPAENKPLAERIAEQGAVVSEYEMGAKPDAVNFPRRNRIISGMTLGTLVVETGHEGGAMITATTALDQNREVFAIPSAVTERRASGTNRLIKEGKALLTESVDDILGELGPRIKSLLKDRAAVPFEPPQDLTLFERRLYDVVNEDPVHIDLLAERAGLSASETLVHLLSLEFKGIVRQLPGKMFHRK